MLVFENEAKGSQRGRKWERSGYEQGIRPVHKMQHVMSLPSTAPAAMEDGREEYFYGE